MNNGGLATEDRCQQYYLLGQTKRVELLNLGQRYPEIKACPRLFPQINISDKSIS
jgi:hypothetical protein